MFSKFDVPRTSYPTNHPYNPMVIHLPCHTSTQILMGSLLDTDTLTRLMETLREAEITEEIRFREKNTERFKEIYGTQSLPSLWDAVLRHMLCEIQIKPLRDRICLLCMDWTLVPDPQEEYRFNSFRGYGLSKRESKRMKRLNYQR
jgi:hypothetical protein